MSDDAGGAASQPRARGARGGAGAWIARPGRHGRPWIARS
jgi:hypothetical protein